MTGLSRRATLFVLLIAALSTLGLGVALAYFEDRSSNPQSIDSVADFLPPVTKESVIQKTLGGSVGYIGTTVQYRAYASITDSGNPPSGIQTVSADLSAISNAAGSTPMSAGSWTVGGVNYNYRTALTAVAGTTSEGSKSYSIYADDFAGYSDTTGGFSVVVDNTVPAGSNVRATNTSGGDVGEAEQGDTVTYTYNDPVDPQSVLTGWSGAPTSVTVLLKGTQNSPGSGSELTILSTAIGPVDLKGSYTHPKNRNVNFNGSTMVLSGNTIQITLGVPDANDTRQESNAQAPTWVPGSGTYDRAGNAINTATTTGTNAVQF